MKKAFLMYYMELNYGDDLFVNLLCNRYPNTQFYTEYKKGKVDGIKDIPNLILLKKNTFKGFLHRIAKKISINWMNMCVYIYIGGSLFHETAETDICKIELPKRYWKDLPVFILGANFGPFITQKYVDKYHEIFTDCSGICFRDKKSYNLFRDIDCVRYAPDIIFNYKLPVVHKEKSIAISVIGEKIGCDYQKYLDKIVDVVKFYINMGFSIKLLSFCESEGDKIASMFIESQIDVELRNKVKCYSYDGNVERFTKVLISSDFIIATRFHSMILGWLSDVPVFPVVYNEKMENVINDFGFKGRYVSLNDFGDVSLIDIEYNRLHKITLENLDVIIKEAEKQFSFLDEILD